MREAQQVCTLRELALAVHAFDRAFNECSNTVMGRPFTGAEIQALLKIVRERDPREVDVATLRLFMSEIK